MRKIISLALLGILSLSLFGCYEKNDLYKELDTEKAEKVALDYMNEKYDKDFYVVSSNKYKEMSYAPGKINDFWCDVEIAIEDSEEDKNYTVRTTLDDDGEYVIEWDDYMTSLVSPLAKRDINDSFSEVNITNYSIYSFYISEIGTAGGFRPDFDVDIEHDTLDSVFEKNSIWLHFNLCIPESAYKDSTVSDFEKALGLYLPQENSDDYVRVKVLSFNDDYYSEIKNAIESGDRLPDNYEWKAIHTDTIYIKED